MAWTLAFVAAVLGGIVAFNELLPEISKTPLEIVGIGSIDLQSSQSESVVFALPNINHFNVVSLPIGIGNPNDEEITSAIVTLSLQSEHAEILPEKLTTEPVTIGSVFPEERKRTSAKFENTSTSTTTLGKIAGDSRELTTEMIVIKNSYLEQIANGNAPTIRLRVTLRGDDTPESTRDFVLQAVKFDGEPDGNRSYNPLPSALPAIAVYSQMELRDYDGLKCYVAEPLSTRVELIMRPKQSGE